MDEGHARDDVASWEDGGTGESPDLPALPPGYEAQPAWGFRDLTGRFSYEFHRVYGRPDRFDRRGPMCRIDQDLSFWRTTWSTDGDPGSEHVAGWRLTYAQARALRGSRLTFARFSSVERMRADLEAITGIDLEAMQRTRAGGPEPSA